MNNSKKGIVMIVILTIALISVLTVGIINDKKILAKNKLDYEVWFDNNREQGSEQVKEEPKEEEQSKEEQPKEEQPKEEQPKEEAKDFYGKLKNKKPIRLLILGDGIALSQGRNSENGVWERGIASLITSTYGSEVEVKSLAKNGASSGVGYEVVSNNDISNYDLTIICYGQNDNNIGTNINQFKTNYNGIISKVKESNPNGTIIPILPSTLSLENAYRGAIQEIADSISLKVADTKTGFIRSGLPERSLVNGTLPNDTGYQIYTQTIGEVIKSEMDQ